MGLFGLFLSFAAFSAGSPDNRILYVSLFLLIAGWLVLRRPRKEFNPNRRFRTLRRLGLLGGGSQPDEDDE
jgi:hypothetical protein